MAVVVGRSTGSLDVMRKAWLRRRYRYSPSPIRELMLNEIFRSDLRRIRAVAARFPKNYSIQASLANHLHDVGRMAEARRVWNANVHKFGHDAAPYFQRAHWAMKDKCYAEAVKYLSHCLARDKGYFRETAYFWRAAAHIELSNAVAAARDLTAVNDDYYEPYFFGEETVSKSDLINRANAIRS